METLTFLLSLNRSLIGRNIRPCVNISVAHNWYWHKPQYTEKYFYLIYRGYLFDKSSACKLALLRALHCCKAAKY